MPDLFTHFTTGIVLSRFGLSNYRLSLFVLGSIFPDLFARIPTILSKLLFDKNIDEFIIPFHTPIGIMLLLYLFVHLFERRIRGEAFLIMALGSALHLFLDVLQRQFFQSDYFLFFPFCFYAPKIDLFHYDESVNWFFPECILVVFCIYPLFFNKQTNA